MSYSAIALPYLRHNRTETLTLRIFAPNPPVTAEPIPPLHPASPQAAQLQRARASLAATIANYTEYLNSPANQLDESLQAVIQSELAKLATTLAKLDSTTVRIAVFGLVSRGKSAVINALIGDQCLETGPINGLTREVQVLKWTPDRRDADSIFDPNLPLPNLQIELLDTPGLDEVEGETRATLAKDVANQSDLILFIISGDMTRLEYDALCDLRNTQKPLVLVFNKIDLYPETTRNTIYQNITNLGEQSLISSQLQQLLTEAEIALIAADPAPLQVRIEHPDGRTENLWEKPPAQITDLTTKLLTILNREGRSLLALNALTQSRQAELGIAAVIINYRQVDADARIWQFTRYKAIAIGLNPFGFLDFIGGTLSDLTLIRQLSKLYGLPMTQFEAGNLLKTILISSGGLLLSELFGGIVLGFGKGFAALSGDGAGFAAYSSIGLIQAGVAAYGSYSVGRAAQVYLEQGCTWGAKGANTVIREILSQVDRNTIIHRIREELM